MQTRCRAIFLIFFFSLFSLGAFSNPYSSIAKAFNIFTNLHEGEIGFRSLLIHPGGRMAGLNGAFTALANDITFIESNPAASSSLRNTELAFFHNAWIADSHLDTISYAMRSGNLGYGASLRCFYVPFTEYGSYGERVSSGYYSETFATLNVSYNFFNGYKFKGLSIGGNLKAGIQAFPPFQGQYVSDEEISSKIRRNNANKQMSFAVLADFGMQLKGDFFKNFDSKEPNIFLGIAVKNLGIPIKGIVPPLQLSFGFAYRPVKLMTFALDASYPINIANVKHSQKLIFSAGLIFDISQHFNILTGFGVKGGNPSFTLGGEVSFSNVQLSATYALDLTTQTTALNHIAVGIKVILGDRGRGALEEKVERMYVEALHLYQNKNYEDAIKIWEELLKLNKYFEPAKVGIRSAKNMQLLQEEIKKLEKFEY